MMTAKMKMIMMNYLKMKRTVGSKCSCYNIEQNLPLDPESAANASDSVILFLQAGSIGY